MRSQERLSILPKRLLWKDHARMKLWAWDKKNLPSIGHAIRTAVAATASVVIARLVQMPEAYWAAIATLVVMQSTLDATLTLSVERIVATAVGHPLERSRRIILEQIWSRTRLRSFSSDCCRSRFAWRRLRIVIRALLSPSSFLIPRSAPPWSVGLHRFIEVSVGIIVALAVVALWPEHQRPS